MNMDGLQLSHGGDESAFDDIQEPNLPTPPQSGNSMAPAKARQAKATTASATATKAKSKPKRASGGITKPAKKQTAKKAGRPRKALADVSNTLNAPEESEVDDFDELPDSGGVTALAPIEAEDMTDRPTEPDDAITLTNERPAKTKKARPARTQNVAEIPETQQEILPTASPQPSKAAPVAKRRPSRSKNKTVIPETQPDPMEVDESEVQDTEAVDTRDSPATGAHVTRPGPSSYQRRDSLRRKRAGSVSDAERGPGDSTLRRKLADMTKKCESLEARYHNLNDVGVKEAKSNFDELKKQADQKTKAADSLIASLRAELTAQKAISAEMTAVQKRVEDLTSKNDSLTSEKKTLAASLNTAQSEIKTLQAKVAASRSTSNPAQGSEAPGQRAVGPKTVLVSTADAAKEAHKRMLKEELYSDLTGLLLLDVKRREEEGEDVYDCIQTGRNGTLHFHLTVANPSQGSTKTQNGTAEAYHNAEFQYTPLLDEKRDKDLMEILPDYLTEEICFPRSNAAKFYARVADCMTKKVEVIDEEDE